ncbi:hypothetical protein DPMN_028752 [Dreissena polymorpha]|uniref:Ubiquitin carboxyl-terminal hydrolase 36 n=1 Tax=Dreissena polymorpha TaxID=45954 RepID=A0A9D4RGR7_DREPO|nr:hypothetical protein DPMN_028752 [Dreissena polymorpha]
MRVMLLRNIAPSIGLYNGSLHTLVGPIYNRDSIVASLTNADLKTGELQDCITTKPIDTCGKVQQIPPKSVLLSVDDVPYCKDTVDEFPSGVHMTCKFQGPSNPPEMPDFMVIEASNYSGPNILKIPGCENYVSIPPVESYKQKAGKTKSNIPMTRIALPLEGGDAATSFKGQGANFPLAEVDLDGWFHVPGIFLVAISRVRSPAHLHIRTFPNYMDLKVQRLKENVLDAQAFEEAVKVKSERMYRHKNCGDPFWTTHYNDLADSIIDQAFAKRLSIKKDKEELIRIVQLMFIDTDTNVIMRVLEKLIETQEYLVAEAAPHISQEDYETLTNYQKKKSVKPKVLKRQFDDKLSLGGPSCDIKKRKLPTPKQKLSPLDPIPNENLLSLKTRPDISRQTFKGLQNSGNNVCFLNAPIIALCHTRSFDAFLRECQYLHQQCSGYHLQNEICPLCALNEVVNRAYRHHNLPLRDLPKMPIIKQTESLLPGWRLGIEHDADEFLVKLFDRLDQTYDCQIHKGTVKTTKTCQSCSFSKIREQFRSQRILINLVDLEEAQIRIQEGINKWLMEQKLLNCEHCGEKLHDVKRELVRPPSLLIINIHRSAQKRISLDNNIFINNETYEFKASVNHHHQHYTTVGCVDNNHYIFYSDERVQLCLGNLEETEQQNFSINTVRTPLEECAIVLIYERQLHL